MGLFGDLDASEVSDNAFFVADGVYESQLTEFSLRKQKQDDSRYGISFNWTIEEEGDAEGNTISEWINVYPHDDDAPDKRSLTRDRARLKQRLTNLGMSFHEMNNLLIEDEEGNYSLDSDIVDKYIGLEANVTVANTNGKGENSDKVYTNVRKVEAIIR